MSNIRFFAILALGLTAVHAADDDNSNLSDKPIENELDNLNNIDTLSGNENNNNNFQNKERNKKKIKRIKRYKKSNRPRYNNNQIPSTGEMLNGQRIGQRRDDRENSEEGIDYSSSLEIPYLVTMHFTKTGKYLFGAACCVPLFFIIYLIYLQFSTEKASKAPATVHRKA